MKQTGGRKTIRGLIGFEIFIKTACLSFCFPVARFMLNLCIRAAGYSYITKENLSSFLLAPLSLVCMLIALTVAALFVLFEMNATNLALRQHRAGIRVTFSGLFYGGIEKTKQLFRRKSQGVLSAFLALLFVVLVNLPVVFFLFLGLGQTEGAARMAMKPPGLVILSAVTVLLWWFALVGCSIVLLSGAETDGIRNLWRLGVRGIKQCYGRLFFGL
ncbi:MAG: glycerophosphoryl diester phosphodiesterase membrane domain-containing protein, partial [Lachnospiraceae bacterium]